MSKNIYPLVEINLKGIYENAVKIVDECQKKGVDVCGVVKATDSYENSYLQIANRLVDAGCMSIGDARLNTIKRMKDMGMTAPIVMLRLPMLNEIEDLVEYVDMSLNSEIKTIKAINAEALKVGKVHKIMLMMDMGDLREGYFDKNEAVDVSKYIEDDLKGIKLTGIGTNLGCFGSIVPDTKNLTELVEIGNNISKAIGRKLDYISGGGTSTLPLVLDGTLPKGINHLRLGEGIILARDLDDVWGFDFSDYNQNNYVLKAQIIEIKDKPSYPIGKIFVDAFGNTPEYEDKGTRKRALIAVGKRDIYSERSIIPRIDGMTVEGGSSDHMILDITDCKEELKVGDIIEFDMYYQAMLYSVNSRGVTKRYVEY